MVLLTSIRYARVLTYAPVVPKLRTGTRKLYSVALSLLFTVAMLGKNDKRKGKRAHAQPHARTHAYVHLFFQAVAYKHNKERKYAYPGPVVER